MTRYSRVAMVATSIVAAASAGTAGVAAAPPTIAKATLITRADSACTRFHARVGRVPEPKVAPSRMTVADLPAVARYIDRIMPPMRVLNRRLHALGRPDRDAKLWQRILADFRGDMRLLRQEGIAAHQRDLHAFKRAAAKSDSPRGPGAEGSRLAHRFGLHRCG